jgi:hypothetical protein
MNANYSNLDQGSGYEKKDSKSTVYIITIILLAILAVVFMFLYFQSRKETGTLIVEKEDLRIELQGELDSLMIEHEKIKQDYGTLADSLSVKDSLIQANAVEIKRLLDTEWEYYKVKKKLDQLRDITQGYVRQIDSLYTVNRELKEENIAIKQSYEAEQRKSEGLQKDKEELTQKITEAAVLDAYNISAYGVRFKSADDEKETDKAKKTDKIKICFTLAENQLIPEGTKNIYIRIARPDNLILTKGKGDEYSFEYQGAMLQYSIMESIEYLKQAKEVCTYWIHRSSYEPLIEGTYVVTVFAENSEIGQTSFVLQ